MRQQVKAEEIHQVVEVILGIPEVQPEDRLIEDLRAESVDIVNLVAALEDRYNLSISEEALADLRTVDDLVGLIQQQPQA